ncbi:hypothetical protein PIB30_077305 [Stylosanthes scabra]|uniref:Uncharacterized protein n=1 Tax=Stylosanthes scabra TaxID=79078 RepID=A0ABU6VQC8_9FABA|nr:hypothetical protein [Stylosanthes scabra]
MGALGHKAIRKIDDTTPSRSRRWVGDPIPAGPIRYATPEVSMYIEFDSEDRSDEEYIGETDEDSDSFDDDEFVPKTEEGQSFLLLPPPSIPNLSSVSREKCTGGNHKAYD